MTNQQSYFNKYIHSDFWCSMNNYIPSVLLNSSQTPGTELKTEDANVFIV